MFNKGEASICVDVKRWDGIRPSRANINKGIYVQLVAGSLNMDSVDLDQYTWFLGDWSRRG